MPCRGGWGLGIRDVTNADFGLRNVETCHGMSLRPNGLRFYVGAPIKGHRLLRCLLRPSKGRADVPALSFIISIKRLQKYPHPIHPSVSLLLCQLNASSFFVYMLHRVTWETIQEGLQFLCRPEGGCASYRHQTK